MVRLTTYFRNNLQTHVILAIINTNFLGQENYNYNISNYERKEWREFPFMLIVYYTKRLLLDSYDANSNK